MGLEAALIILVLLVLAWAVLVTILAIAAVVRVRRLEQDQGSQGFERLNERLTLLERLVDGLRPRGNGVSPGREPPAPPPEEATERAVERPVAVAVPSVEPRPSRRMDLERLIAGRWMNIVGIFALLLAVSFFVKYAFDSDWVGTRGRVVLGLLAGTGLLVYSHWLFRRGYRFFSHGMAALGGGILYLSLFAAWSYYSLLPQGGAFAGMAAVTAALATLALARASQFLALLALVGGLMTPGLLGTGRDAQVELFTYLLILNTGALGVAWKRGWRVLELVALPGTLLYYAGWFDRFYTAAKLASTLGFTVLFYAQFSVPPVAQSRKRGRLRKDRIVLVIVNALWFLMALNALLYRHHRWGLTLAVLILAALHLGLARLSGSEEGRPALARQLFAGLALTFVTVAIPIRLEGKWITLAWAVEGAVLVWTGFRSRLWLLRGAGQLLLGVIIIRLLLIPLPGGPFLWNPRFATTVAGVGSLAVALLAARRYRGLTSGAEEKIFAVLAVAANVLAIQALSLEIWNYAGSLRLGAGDVRLMQQLGLSVLWTLYASLLVFAGMRLKTELARWQGLALFALVIGKVFIYDLSFLERVYRILSFLALGTLLVVVSFLYQRRLAASRTEDSK